jgi:hypothetical protein
MHQSAEFNIGVTAKENSWKVSLLMPPKRLSDAGIEHRGERRGEPFVVSNLDGATRFGALNAEDRIRRAYAST